MTLQGSIGNKKSVLKKQHATLGKRQMQGSVCAELDCLWEQIIKEHQYMLPVLRDVKALLVMMVNDHM
jgi:hypothetical protein